VSTQKRPSEGGQVLVLVVLGIIVLLGFTALAVDGGMLYSDRRFAKNGADTGSLAGGGAAGQTFGLVVTNNNWDTINPDCVSGSAAQAAKDEAIAYAAKNGLTITAVDTKTEYDAGENVVYTECGVETPIPGFEKHYMDVYVKITHETQTTFAHFVYKGSLANTVYTITRVYPVQPYGYGNVIVALNDSAACNPIKNGSTFNGLSNPDPDIEIWGGGIFSNGCVHPNNSNMDIIIHDGNVSYGTGLDNQGAFTLDNGSFVPITQTLNLDEFNPDVPDCTGHYVNANTIDNASGLSGLYCVNGDLNVNGGDVMQGTDVTFVMLGGTVTINGGSDTSLKAPLMDYVGSAMPGILFYLPVQYYGSLDGTGCGSPNQELKINGGSYSELRGTILAPCSDISVEGTADNTINGQIIGWNVDFGGDTGSALTYIDNQNGWKPASLDLYR
jgi:hypothetical protein